MRRGHRDARILRPNAVDTLTGKNTGTGAGRGIPFLHFEEWDDDRIEVRMILKGGGSENVGTQYKLPDSRLKAGRDLEGVRRAVLDAVVEAQGKGCAPGVLGVCVGGDRVSAFAESKRQLLRPLDDTQPGSRSSPSSKSGCSRRATSSASAPWVSVARPPCSGSRSACSTGFPACYFVTVTYMCWADRKAGVSIDGGGEVTWLS